MEKFRIPLRVDVTLFIVLFAFLAGCATPSSPVGVTKRYVVGRHAIQVDQVTTRPAEAVSGQEGAVEAAVEAEPLSMEEEFRQATTSADYERFVAKYQPDELAFVALQRLAKPYLDIKDWHGAIGVFEAKRGGFPGMEARFDKIIALLRAPSQDLSVTNLGPGINGKGEEYHPVLAADGKTIFFARESAATKGEDIMISVFDGVQWSRAVEIGKPINTSTHEVPLGISADGNKLTIFGNYTESFGRGDIFYAEKEGECWSMVKHYPAPINTTDYESDAMLPADGKTMMLVSERPGVVGDRQEKGPFFHGGYGGNTDILVAVETSSGTQVVNLGPIINTPYSEYSPFLHPDGKTLYFSSDGHAGLGGLDVFKSTRLSDTSWTEWSEPINLGKDVNGPHDDWGYQVATSGELAFFSTSSRIDSYGGNDIYSTKLPAEVKPNAVTAVSGRVLDPQGNPIAGAAIIWNDLTLNVEAGRSTSAPVSGEYFIALPAGHMYGFYADKEGYVGKSENLDLTDKAEYAEYHMDITLYPVERLVQDNVVIRLNNIFFDFDKSDLKEESIFELDRWVKFLGKYGNINVEFHGHADWIGTDEYNQKLSERRAGAVMQYLLDQGTPADRMTAIGFGESMPVASNETDEGRAQNRRVEIHFKTNSLR